MKPLQRFCRFALICAFGLLVAACHLQAATTTPSLTITASNVSISGQGTAVSKFTLTSVDGFTGQVGVTCTGPNANLPDLVLPECSHPVQNFVIPANGSVSGSITLYPPWTDGYTSSLLNRKRGSTRPSPLCAALFAGFGLLGLRLRKPLKRGFLAAVLTAISLASLLGVGGCLSPGGLAMTPGTYTYTIVAGAASTNFSVTVNCDSCP